MPTHTAVYQFEDFSEPIVRDCIISRGMILLSDDASFQQFVSDSEDCGWQFFPIAK